MISSNFSTLRVPDRNNVNSKLSSRKEIDKMRAVCKNNSREQTTLEYWSDQDSEYEKNYSNIDKSLEVSFYHTGLIQLIVEIASFNST